MCVACQSTHNLQFGIAVDWLGNQLCKPNYLHTYIESGLTSLAESGHELYQFSRLNHFWSDQTNFGHQIWSAHQIWETKVICVDHFLTKPKISLQDYFVGSYVSTCSSKYETVKVNGFAVANLYFTQMATISKFKNTVCGKSLVITNHV